MYAELIPAYGRDYKNQKEVRDAWYSNQDFVLCDFRGTTMINKKDAENSPYTTVNIRYCRKTKVLPIKVLTKPKKSV